MRRGGRGVAEREGGQQLRWGAGGGWGGGVTSAKNVVLNVEKRVVVVVGWAGGGHSGAKRAARRQQSGNVILFGDEFASGHSAALHTAVNRRRARAARGVSLPSADPHRSFRRQPPCFSQQ